MSITKNISLDSAQVFDKAAATQRHASPSAVCRYFVFYYCFSYVVRSPSVGRFSQCWNY